MGFDARLAGIQFALLPRCCTAGRTRHGKALLKVQLSNHGRDDAPKRDRGSGQFCTETQENTPLARKGITLCIPESAVRRPMSLWKSILTIWAGQG
jgi:hypothetical protein